MKLINFRDEDMYIYRTTYRDNENTAIILENLDGEMYTVATVNTNESLPENQAYIKDYSENTGILTMLKDEKIVTKRLGFKKSGFITLELWELDLDNLKLIKN